MNKLLLNLALLIALPLIFAGCGNEDTPQDAFKEIGLSLAERDSQKFSERINLDEFFAATYDEITPELAARCDEYSAKYPDDTYFKRGGDFLRNYNQVHRERHLDFLKGVRDAYFMKIPEPENPEDNPQAYIACEFKKIFDAIGSEITDTKIDGNIATVTAGFSGDNSLQGHFVGQIEVKFTFEKIDGKWRLVKIANLPEILPQIVDKAELVWVTFY